MAESVNDLGSLGRALSEQIGEQIRSNAPAFGLELDEQFVVHGGSGRGGAAFVPTVDLSRTTVDQVSSGAVLGLVAINRTEYPSDAATGDALPIGVFAIRVTVGTDGSDGTSELLDAAGTVVAKAPLRTLASRDRFAEVGKEDVSVEVGRVTVSVGWIHVCFDWDDPPGSGGMCHHTCYGW